MKKIGIIGNGYVGNAIASFFKQYYEVLIYDIIPEKSNSSFEDIITADILFVCLPTPTVNNKQDLSILNKVIAQLNKCECRSVIVIKSTILPGTTESLSNKYPNLTFVYNPEFLSARTAKKDFAAPISIILGSGKSLKQKAALSIVKALYEKHFNAPIYCYDYTTAEMIKYARNTFFAVKIGFWNEIYQLCLREGIDYNDIKEGVLASQWVNPMHCNVPGSDGKLGFGGACFPKDIKAFDSFAPDNLILKAIISSNEKIRRFKNERK